MLNRVELLQMLVGLREVNDIDLVDNAVVLDAACIDSDRQRIRAAASLIDQILTEFDYEQSPEFLETLEGKSEHLRRMKRLLLTSEKRTKAAQRLGGALVSILESDSAYRLIPSEQHNRLDELREIINTIAQTE